MSKLDACVMQQVSGLRHAELVWLYTYEEGISTDLVKHVLLLPRESLLVDLEHILNGAEDYYASSMEDMEAFELRDLLLNDGFQTIHCLFLLSELKAHECLAAVVGFMERLPLIGDMYHDCVTEYTWMYFHHIFPVKKQELEALVCDARFSAVTRISVASGIGSWYIHNAEYRDESIAFWERVLVRLRDNADVDDEVDCDFLTMIACNVMDAKLPELLPLLKEFDAHGYLVDDVMGDMEEIEEELLDGGEAVPELPLKTIFEIYEELIEIDNFSDLGSGYDDDKPFVNIEPVRSEPKIGRNDPCICGSGKKYKKCCMVE
jgi:hypothetical protein